MTNNGNKLLVQSLGNGAFRKEMVNRLSCAGTEWAECQSGVAGRVDSKIRVGVLQAGKHRRGAINHIKVDETQRG